MSVCATFRVCRVIALISLLVAVAFFGVMAAPPCVKRLWALKTHLRLAPHLVPPCFPSRRPPPACLYPPGDCAAVWQAAWGTGWVLGEGGAYVRVPLCHTHRAKARREKEVRVQPSSAASWGSLMRIKLTRCIYCEAVRLIRRDQTCLLTTTTPFPTPCRQQIRLARPPLRLRPPPTPSSAAL
jgi:hypothetical protein